MSYRFRVAFFGRGELGMTVLRGLLQLPEIEVPIVISCPASPELSFTPEDFETEARAHGAAYLHRSDLNSDEIVHLLESLQLDLAVAMLWVNTISADVVRACGAGIINLHGGDLPRYRGNACQSWAILNRESHIGVTCHLMEGGHLDSGPVLSKASFPIDSSTRVGDAVEAVTRIGGEMVLDVVPRFLRGQISPQAQVHADSLYTYPRLPRDGEIDWTQSADDIHAHIRSAGRPYPGAYSWFRDVRNSGRLSKLTVWDADVIDHPSGRFRGVPGHVIRLSPPEPDTADPSDCAWGVITGDSGVILLKEVARDGVAMNTSRVFRSARQRLGLDVASEIASLSRMIDELRLPQSAGPSEAVCARMHHWFRLGGSMEMIEFETQVAAAVDRLSSQLLSQGIELSRNPLRNLSFRRSFFQWEDREVDFGIQIYQSLEVSHRDYAGLCTGFWIMSTPDALIEHRLYSSFPEQLSPSLQENILTAYQREFGGGAIHAATSRQRALVGVYAKLQSQDFLAGGRQIFDLLAEILR